jgi:hypothetical protein
MVAISRTEDNRRRCHSCPSDRVLRALSWTDHWQDVFIGSLLGMFICRCLFPSSLRGLLIKTAFVSYRTYYRASLRHCSTPMSPLADPIVAPLHHHQCHLPLAPRASEPDDNEDRTEPQRVRLLGPEENGAVSRASEEAVWRGSQ